MLIKGYPSTAFDAGQDRLFVVTHDSLYTLSVKGSGVSAAVLSVRQDNLLLGNQSLFNPHNQGLYNFYTDQHIATEYNFAATRWDQHFAPGPVTEYWHVNKFFSKTDSALYVLGGYGQLRYKNKVQRYGLADRNWKEIPAGGDYFTPRYLAGLGTTRSGDSAYILGGYGSKDGDQLLNPQYIYELSLYDVRARSFKKIYSLKQPPEPFVFANSLIIDETDKFYYALVFSKDRFNSNLQLIRGSLQKPAYELMANPFPYSFADNRSFADLYYSAATQSLLAVTQYANSDNNTTEVKVYRISCPPNLLNVQTAIPVRTAGKKWWWGMGIILAIGIGGVVYFRGRSDSKVEKVVEEEAQQETAVAVPGAKIYFFGNFEVMASNGEELTKLFTPLLKELFLLLAMDSIRWGKGVSAEKINETLWNDRNTKDAINNRSVNIAKLKNILEKVGGCTITKTSGYWKLDFDEGLVQVDFARYVQLFRKPVRSKASMEELISIVHRGPFLPQAEYPWLDNIKSEISNFIIDGLLKYCESLPLPEHAEIIITICDSIFFFDESNEVALRFKCKSLIALGRHTLAKNTFEKFNAKYREIYGEDYSETYAALISL
jgi:two-component SAPR family response regulator